MFFAIIVIIVIGLWINYVMIGDTINSAKSKIKKKNLLKEIENESKEIQAKNRIIVSYTCIIDNKYASIFKHFSTQLIVNGKTYDDKLNGYISIPFKNLNTISIECKLIGQDKICNIQRKTFNVHPGYRYYVEYKTNPVPGQTYPNEIIIKQYKL